MSESEKKAREEAVTRLLLKNNLLSGTGTGRWDKPYDGRNSRPVPESEWCKTTGLKKAGHSFRHGLPHNHHGKIIYSCDIPGCDCRGLILSQHFKSRHNIGVVWHHCPKCDYKSKARKTTKNHIEIMHDWDGTYFHCNEVGCVYEGKHKLNLKRSHEKLPHIHKTFLLQPYNP